MKVVIWVFRIMPRVSRQQAVCALEEVYASEWFQLCLSFHYKKTRRISICNTWQRDLMQGGSRTKKFNTTNLISHLNFHHPELYKDCQTKGTTAVPITTVKQVKKLNLTVREGWCQSKTSHTKFWNFFALHRCSGPWILYNDTSFIHWCSKTYPYASEQQCYWCRFYNWNL